MSALEWFLNLLFPRRCLSCGRFGEYICRHCVSMIQFIDTNICPVCGNPAIDGKTHPRCQKRYSMDGLTSFFSYQGVIREAIKRIKYKPWAFDISQSLVELALKRIKQEGDFFNFFNQLIKYKPILVPVPLHPSRERWRGFNQSEVLGRIFAQKWNLSFLPHLLIRTKKTQPQYGLKTKKRSKNVKDAFQVSQEYSHLFARRAGKDFEIESGWVRQNSDQFVKKLEGHLRNVLLIDDIWTTGTTMRACSNILKRAGVKFIWGLTLAR